VMLRRKHASHGSSTGPRKTSMPTQLTVPPACARVPQARGVAREQPHRAVADHEDRVPGAMSAPSRRGRRW
jgi:hypothetical protein